HHGDLAPWRYGPDGRALANDAVMVLQGHESMERGGPDTIAEDASLLLYFGARTMPGRVRRGSASARSQGDGIYGVPARDAYRPRRGHGRTERRCTLDHLARAPGRAIQRRRQTRRDQIPRGRI